MIPQTQHNTDVWAKYMSIFMREDDEIFQAGQFFLASIVSPLLLQSVTLYKEVYQTQRREPN